MMEVSRMPEKSPETDESIVKRISESLDLTVDKVVEEINGICRNQIDPGMKILGTYLLDVVFDGDIQAAQSRNPRKEISLKKICSHPEYEGDAKRPQEALQISIFRRECKKNGKDIDRLSPTKALLISRARNKNEAFVLAQEALEKGYSVAVIKEKLREGQPSKTTEKKIREVLRNYKTQENEESKEILDLLKDKERLRTELKESDRDSIKKEASKIREAMEGHLKLIKRLEKSLIAILAEGVTPSES
jgi:hypothetical protein